MSTKLALRFAATRRAGKDDLMIERGVGYWLDPDGQFVPTPPRVSHAEVIRAVINESQLSEDAREQFTIDANAYAISQGWSRVRIYPGQKICYVDFGQGRQQVHAPRVDELLDQLDMADVSIKYTDEQGNYTSP